MVSNQPLLLTAGGCLLTKGENNSYRERTGSSRVKSEVPWLTDRNNHVSEKTLICLT